MGQVWFILLGLLVFLALLAVKVAVGVYLRMKRLEKFGLLPGGHWLLGHLKHHPGPNEEGMTWFSSMAEQSPCKRTFVARFLNRVALYVTHPETIKELLATAQPKDNMLRRFLHPLLGDGLVLSSGRKWARNRKLLTPAFHFNILHPYVDVYNAAADRLCCQLLRLSGEGEAVDVSGPISASALDVIMRCAFSYNDDDLQTLGVKHPYSAVLRRASRLFSNRIFTVHQKFDFIFKLTPSGREFARCCEFLHSVSNGVIAKRKRELEENPDLLKDKKLVDFLDILLTARDESGSGLSDADIRAEVDTFMAAGHDTTANAILWILNELANHPEEQEKCRQEIEEILKGRQTSDVAWSDLSQMRYTTFCIKETMRLTSAVNILMRTTSNEITIDGKTVPAGTNIVVWLNIVHHSPDIWGPDAHEFRPERFLPENMTGSHSHAFVPFSAGPRNCIGQNFAMNEIKVTLAKLLMRFDFSPDPERIPRRRTEIVTLPEDGMHLYLKAR